jgi:hypothetical protein
MHTHGRAWQRATYVRTHDRIILCAQACRELADRLDTPERAHGRHQRSLWKYLNIQLGLRSATPDTLAERGPRDQLHDGRYAITMLTVVALLLSY